MSVKLSYKRFEWVIVRFDRTFFLAYDSRRNIPIKRYLFDPRRFHGDTITKVKDARTIHTRHRNDRLDCKL